MWRTVCPAVVFLPPEDALTTPLHIPPKPLIPGSQYLNPANPVNSANRNYVKHLSQLFKKCCNIKTTKVQTNHLAMFCWTLFEQGFI